MIDFTPLKEDISVLLEFSQQFSVDDLRDASNAYLDKIKAIVSDMNDAQLAFIPDDPEADDSHAPEDEQNIGWSVAHLVLHVTASVEESATFASLLARGITFPQGTRFRYEPDWHEVDSHAEITQRIAECRRMLLGYLDTFPDEPHLAVFRETREGSPLTNKINAIGAFLFGLMHFDGHTQQFDEAKRQSLAALPN